jgi:ribosome-binding factor A
VTAVETSSDLRHARVFVSVLGDSEERDRTLAGLASSHGVLQAGIARELRLKRTPTLEFRYDDSVDRSMRISELLEREGGSQAGPGPGSPES